MSLLGMLLGILCLVRLVRGLLRLRGAMFRFSCRDFSRIGNIIRGYFPTGAFKGCALTLLFQCVVCGAGRAVRYAAGGVRGDSLHVSLLGLGVFLLRGRICLLSIILLMLLRRRSLVLAGILLR